MRLIRRLWIIGVALLLFPFLPTLTGFITDWMWFNEVGFLGVYRTELIAKFLLFAGGAVVAYLFITINARIAAWGRSSAPALWRANPELPPIDIGRSLTRLVTPVGILAALLFGITAASSWMDVLQVTHRSSFGVVDPVFGKDVGYYVFALPAIASFLGILRGLVIF